MVDRPNNPFFVSAAHDRNNFLFPALSLLPLISGRFPPSCKMEAKWMFGHLDLNNDGLLSPQELYDLEHDQNERCIKPFIDTCSMDQDSTLNPREWCRCFEKTDRPCAAVRRRLSKELLGSYSPDCDMQGFYKATQCHSSVGVCWCVDKHGVEFANTRSRGNKPNCGNATRNKFLGASY